MVSADVRYWSIPVDHDDSRNGRNMNASATVVQTVWAEIRRDARIAVTPLADSEGNVARAYDVSGVPKLVPIREEGGGYGMTGWRSRLPSFTGVVSVQFKP